MKTLCATMILINPMAKFALTMEPVALNVRAKATTITGMPENYWTRCYSRPVVLMNHVHLPGLSTHVGVLACLRHLCQPCGVPLFYEVPWHGYVFEDVKANNLRAWL
jgi:hypothetical protein